MHKSRQKWQCVDCNKSTKLEHYFVKNEVWFGEAKMSEDGMLHVICLEKRILRLLGPEDFTDAFVNDPKKNPMTDVLRSRITGVGGKNWGVEFWKLITDTKSYTRQNRVYFE